MNDRGRLQWPLVAVMVLLGATLALAVVGSLGVPVLGSVGQVVGLVGSSGILWATARRWRFDHGLRARGWSLVAYGLGVLAIAVLPYLFSPVPPPVYSLVELAGVPPVLVGLGLVRRTLTAPAKPRRLAVLDGTLVGTAGVVLAWMVAFEPFVGRHPLSSVVAVGVFPLAGLLVLSYWVLPLLLLDRHNPVARSLVLVTVSITAVSLAAAVVGLAAEVDVRRLHGWYGVAVALGALAVVSPLCWQHDELVLDSAFLDRERIALISVSLAVIPAVLLGSAVAGARPNLVVPGVGAAVMVSLVAVRLRGALHDAAGLQSRLRYLAEVDPLTGLPNRRAAEERLVLIEEGGLEVAVMFIDLDGFKAVNDQRGHAVGDLLLCEVSDRLRACVRADDLLARFGGDEFVVVAPGLPSEQAELVARRIQRSLNGAYDLDGVVEWVGASVGFAIGGGSQGPGACELVDLADQAMYEAKAAGKGRVRRASSQA